MRPGAYDAREEERREELGVHLAVDAEDHEDAEQLPAHAQHLAVALARRRQQDARLPILRPFLLALAAQHRGYT